MHIKTIVSAGALAIVLGLGSTAAFAQMAATTLPTMIGNQELTPADAERVQVRCDDLYTRANQAEGATNDDVDAPATEEAGGAASTAAVGSVDMSLITVESCTEAGFLTTVGN